MALIFDERGRFRNGVKESPADLAGNTDAGSLAKAKTHGSWPVIRFWYKILRHNKYRSLGQILILFIYLNAHASYS
jgi:hypothetical protein